MLIDLDHYRESPFYYDVMMLPLRAALARVRPSKDLFAAFVSGVFDDGLERLLSAGGYRGLRRNWTAIMLSLVVFRIYDLASRKEVPIREVRRTMKLVSAVLG